MQDSRLLLEIPRAGLDMAMLATSPWLMLSPRGDGHGVFVMPGLGADDFSTSALRTFLSARGYRTSGWRLGRNLGLSRLGGPERLYDAFERFAARHQEPVSVIGWSLGGVYARRLARQMPERIRQVICLGSPIGMDNEPLPRGIHCTSVYTRNDAVVPFEYSRLATAPTHANVEVDSSHLGLGFNPAVYGVIAERLAKKI